MDEFYEIYFKADMPDRTFPKSASYDVAPDEPLFWHIPSPYWAD